jgi:APA family basic amino acid/polyamine antiporter
MEIGLGNRIGKRMTIDRTLKFDRDIPLVRTLNLIQTIFMGIGTAIGGVIFAIMGIAIEAAGPSIVLTFLIGAFFALIIGLSYAELGASVPEAAGGAISFVRRAFGEGLITFIAGWFSWIGSITDASIGSMVFALSVQYFFRWIEPFSLAIVTLIVFTLINFKGTQMMSKTQFFLTLILIFTLIVYITGASFRFEFGRFEPIFPYGVLPTFYMVSFIFPTYAGYESITQLSEEVKTAGKTIPRALLLTWAAITLLFTGTAIATIGGVPKEVYFGSNTPLQDAASYFLGPIGGIVISIASIVASVTTVNGSIAGGTRIAYSLSRSKFLPSFFDRVHPRYRSPYTALALTALLAIAFILTRSMNFIVYAITLGYSVTAIMVCLALIRLRKNEPQLYRPFRVPFYPITPIMSIIVLVFMIAALSFESLVLGSILGIVGLILYRLTRKSRVKA